MATPVFKTYADLMRDLFPCHAFWNPVPDTRLKPGSYGYVDKEGDWVNLGNVRDDPMFAKLKDPVQDRNLGWGIRKTSTIDSQNNTAGLNLKPPSLPASFNVCLKYESKSASGAFLIPSEKLTSCQYTCDHLFRQWAYTRAQKIREQDDDVGIHGFFVVSKTLTTPEVWTAAFQSKQKGGNVTFSADVYEAAGVKVGRQWFCSRISEGDNHRSVEIAKQEAVAKGIDDGVKSYVVAIGGTYFGYYKWKKYKIREIDPANGHRLHWFREPKKSSDALSRAMKAAGLAPPETWETKPIETITNEQLSQMLDHANHEPEGAFYGLEDSEGKAVKAEKGEEVNWRVPAGYLLVEYKQYCAPMTEAPELVQQAARARMDEGGVLA